MHSHTKLNVKTEIMFLAIKYSFCFVTVALHFNIPYFSVHQLTINFLRRSESPVHRSVRAAEWFLAVSRVQNVFERLFMSRVDVNYRRCKYVHNWCTTDQFNRVESKTSVITTTNAITDTDVRYEQTRLQDNYEMWVEFDFQMYGRNCQDQVDRSSWVFLNDVSRCSYCRVWSPSICPLFSLVDVIRDFRHGSFGHDRSFRSKLSKSLKTL